ncbi:MAG: cyclic nucleotide-binding domain-containing protein [Deltaproteobacteria bacterium]|nr:cyclic nucleotide-binding domain-containing protein [Deltaproteobacteria bacterium]
MPTKVLIAHGNTQRLKRAVAELQTRGFEVTATPDGGDAFARFFEDMPDLVICSEFLPGLSGVNFARMVRSQSPGTPVIILVDGQIETAGQEFDIQPDPLNIEWLLEAYPGLIPEQPINTDKSLKAPNTTEVFTIAALKRFQRGSNPLALLDEIGLNAMARIAEKQTCDDGDLIIRQGDRGDNFYLVIAGQVRVTLREQADAEVARIGEGGFFGEMALLSDQPRSASVWAVGSTTLLSFGREQFLPILESYPSLREMLKGVAIERSEENLWSVLLADDDVQESLANLADIDELVLSPNETDDSNTVIYNQQAADDAITDEIPIAQENTSTTAETDVDTDTTIESETTLESETSIEPETTISDFANETAESVAPTSFEETPSTAASEEKTYDELESQTITTPTSFWQIVKQAPRQALIFAGIIGLSFGTLLTIVVVFALSNQAVNQVTDTPSSSTLNETKQANPPTTAEPEENRNNQNDNNNAESENEKVKQNISDNNAVKTEPTNDNTKSPTITNQGATPDKPSEAKAAIKTITNVTPIDAEPSKISTNERRSLRRQFFSSLRKRDYKNAAAIGRKLYLASPNDWEIQLRLADSERSLGNLDVALTGYLSFIEKYPTNVHRDDAQFWAADILISKGKKLKAKELLQQILNNPKTHYRTGAKERVQKIESENK